MRTFNHIPLPELLAEAAAWRGEVVETADPVVDRIRSAGGLLTWGASEQEATTHLIESGATPEEAFLCVKAGRVL